MSSFWEPRRCDVSLADLLCRDLSLGDEAIALLVVRGAAGVAAGVMRADGTESNMAGSTKVASMTDLVRSQLSGGR